MHYQIKPARPTELDLPAAEAWKAGHMVAKRPLVPKVSDRSFRRWLGRVSSAKVHDFV
jgi:hypothetical protein